MDNLGLVIELDEISRKDVNEALQAIDTVLDAADAATAPDNKEWLKENDLAEEEEIDGNKSLCTRVGNFVEHIHRYLGKLISDNRSKVKIIILVVLFLLYNAYFMTAIWYQTRGESFDWCDGIGFLIIVTSVVYVCLFYFQIVKRFWGRAIYRSFLRPFFSLFHNRLVFSFLLFTI